jgi:hypothetical protein
MVDMHTQYTKIEEDNELPEVLSAKKNLEIWTIKEIDSVVTIPHWLKSAQGVLPSGVQTLPYNLGDMHNLTSKIWGDTTIKK